MRVMAQVAMVMNLDKCIGCHTCSVTCKQVWTNRPGTEYVYFNNVETKPGTGYPKRYEDQQQWKGGWALDRRGRLQLKSGGRLRRLLSIFYNPDLPSIDDYGDPWTYDYQTLINAPAGHAEPERALDLRAHRQGHEPEVGQQLGRRPGRRARARGRRPGPRRAVGRGQAGVRAGVHVLPAAHLRALPEPVLRRFLPVGGDVQAGRRRHRAGRPGPLPRLAVLRVRLPVQEGVLQPPHRQGGEVHAVLPPHRGRPAHHLLGNLRRPAAVPRAVPLRRRQGARRGGHPRPAGPVRGATVRVPRPGRPGRRGRGGATGHPGGLDRRGPPLTGLRAGGTAQGGPAAAPGIPDAADGLVHPAAVPGGRRRTRGWVRRRRPGPGVRDHRRAAHPGGVPGQPVHRRERGHHTDRAAQARRRPGPDAGRAARARRPTTSLPGSVSATAATSTTCTGCWPSPSTTTGTSSRPPTPRTPAG